MLTMYFQPVLSQTKILSAEELQLPPKDMQWFRYAKFGMMIHWGLYSIPGQGEWVMFNHRIDTREYAKLADRFDALAQRWPINSTVSWEKVVKTSLLATGKEIKCEQDSESVTVIVPEKDQGKIDTVIKLETR
ncbi:MAG: alpha-L-fucosidase [Bacteroidota bacterium]|nr:alpha-L-fucosidase [Bacteroidota bacterium]